MLDNNQKDVFVEKQQRIIKWQSIKWQRLNMDVQKFNNSHYCQYSGHTGKIGCYLSFDWC